MKYTDVKAEVDRRIEKFKQDYCSKCINTKGCVTCVDGNMAKFANTWVWDEEGKADKQAVKNISKEVSKQIVGQVKDYMKKQEAEEREIEEAALQAAIRANKESIEGGMPWRFVSIFKAGMEWQREHDDKDIHICHEESFDEGVKYAKEEMEKEAVEGFIFQLEEYYPKEIIAAYDGELKHGDKVKLIILKDDEQRNTIRDVQGNDKES